MHFEMHDIIIDILCATGANNKFINCMFDIQYYQLLLDKSTPHVAVRWAVWFIAALIYMIRSYILQVFYILRLLKLP